MNCKETSIANTYAARYVETPLKRRDVFQLPHSSPICALHEFVPD